MSLGDQCPAPHSVLENELMKVFEGVRAGTSSWTWSLGLKGVKREKEEDGLSRAEGGNEGGRE